MTPIEKKAIEHVTVLLHVYDTYPIYEVMDKKLGESSLPEEDRKKILKALSEIMSECKKPIFEAKEWMIVLSADEKTKDNEKEN